MLYLMRKYATSWLIKLLLGAIVVVFVLWGVGSYRSQKATWVASVNGETITLEEYKETYSRLIEQLRQQYGNRLDDDLIKLFRVKQQTIDQLIDKRLLLNEARRLNFQISDIELSQAIRSIGAFRSAGVFDSRRYREVLSRNRMTPETFEVLHREAMLIDRFKTYIESNVRVSDPEALEWYSWENAAVDINYVIFDPGNYKNIRATENEIKSFFNQNKESYKTEPKIKVRYLFFDPVSYSPLVSVSDTELQSYYDSNPEEFKVPETVEARHILIRVDQDAAEKEVIEAKQRALAVYEEAKGGKNFSELAKQYSEGPTKNEGGYLGTFKRRDMIKPFADKAFSMQAGEVSEPVRTPFGWHIIKVEKVNKGGTLGFSESKDKIRKKLINDKASIMAYDAAEAAYNASYEEENLAKIAAAQKLIAKTTEFFTRKGPKAKGIKNPSKFSEAAFKLSLNEISDIQDFGNGYYLLQLIEKIPEKIPSLDDIKPKLIADLVRKKQTAAAEKNANDFLASLKNGADMISAAKKLNLTAKSSGYFKRNQSIPGIGYEQQIVDSAFKLSEKKKWPEEAIKGNKGFYVISFKGRKEPERQGFDKKRKQIKDNLLQNKKLEVFSAWLASVRKNSEITIGEEFRDE